MAKKMICASCGGEFDDALAKCPFCDTLNPKGAEEEYMEKLGDVHEDLESLKAVPREEVRQAFKRSNLYLKKVLMVIFVVVLLILMVVGIHWVWERHYYGGNTQEDYLWEQQNFPVMDQMFSDGKYDELVAFARAASDEGHSIYRWQHYEFYNIYEEIGSALNYLEMEANGEKLSKNGCDLLLHAEWRVKGMEVSSRISEEEWKILEPMAERVLEDLDIRWNFTEEEYNAMYEELRKNDGYVAFGTIENFVKKWYQKRD